MKILPETGKGRDGGKRLRHADEVSGRGGVQYRTDPPFPLHRLAAVPLPVPGRI
jgi:hypothetical protein